MQPHLVGRSVAEIVDIHRRVRDPRPFVLLLGQFDLGFHLLESIRVEKDQPRYDLEGICRVNIESLSEPLIQHEAFETRTGSLGVRKCAGVVGGYFL